MPTADDLFIQLNGGEKCTKLDLSSAYHQVLLDEESRQYVTINTHLGLFRYTSLPFGVASSPAIFPKIMDSVMTGLQGVGGILDDLINTGLNDEAHFRNLASALERMSSMGIKLKKEKCVFMKPSLEYLAFMVDRDGIYPSPRKVQAIQEVPVTENPTELKSFLGLINYYRRFIPDMATLAQSSNRLLVENIPWKWSKQCQEAFQKLTGFLQSTPLLAHYDPKKPVRLAIDSSSFGLGAVLSHISEDGEEKPIAFASRTLSSSEQNYSMIEKEALAIIFGVKKFHQYLFGQRFTFLTDHKPLTYILGPKRGIPVLAASRLQRWSIQLAAYTYDIEYRASKNHGNADALSRLPRKTIEEADDWSIEGDQVNKVRIEVVDAKSQWMEVIQMSSTSACATIGALRSLFATHGLPEEIVADNGPQFVAGEMKDFLTSNGVRLCLSSPYHPASNAEAERAVQTFKEAMRVMKNEPGTQTQKLARFLLRYRTTPHTATGCPPAEILMGRRLRTRLGLLRPDLSARMEQKSRRINPMVRRGFEVGEPVMVPLGLRRLFKIDWVRSHTECKLKSCSGKDMSISCEN
ncbi:Retrovirus-related Pol polyprotein from transposon 17.6 [Stylophora pistillata]|uniref:Retrovirus-related Pol polyprotein from transposon 17.6 n=1 Tax=Stylophora pistillata TaxID=50429 RepID=A0A2B4RZ93_STYPI|nr:Retrovirus-related Pol polyprotein from transposon 17.6 [Stylophora pistillata]